MRFAGERLLLFIEANETLPERERAERTAESPPQRVETRRRTLETIPQPPECERHVTRTLQEQAVVVETTQRIEFVAARDVGHLTAKLLFKCDRSGRVDANAASSTSTDSSLSSAGAAALSGRRRSPSRWPVGGLRP